jgi:hypothetical protein
VVSRFEVEALKLRRDRCRRAASTHLLIALGLLGLGFALGCAYVVVGFLLNSEPPLLGGLFMVIGVAPAWVFFNKKSKLEDEGFAIDRMLKEHEDSNLG